jgi:DNA-binding NarL/FixJ family response regulator
MRFKDSSNSYRVVLHQVRAVSVSKDNKIEKVITIQTDITHLKLLIDYNFSLISETLPSFYSIDSGIDYELIENNFKNFFTKREKEIVKKISEGLSFKEIASELNISPNTVTTHKKNILRKSECKNTAELITKAVREGII